MPRRGVAAKTPEWTQDDLPVSPAVGRAARIERYIEPYRRTESGLRKAKGLDKEPIE